ncbi:hypothetical protein D4Q85_00050 [bacterium]|nr:MAG: hypothetical protein D4Q85_00050 [bacterium]
MAVEENYVKLMVGIPVVLKFDNFAWQSRQIVDPDLGFAKSVRALVFHVSELDGALADTVFSVISTTTQKEFEPYLLGDKYKRYRFTMIKERAGFAPPRIMVATPI